LEKGESHWRKEKVIRERRKSLEKGESHWRKEKVIGERRKSLEKALMSKVILVIEGCPLV
jgi:hypothetical protein